MKSSIIMILWFCFLVLTIVLTMYKGWKIKLEEQSKEVVTVTHTEKCVTVTTSLLYLSSFKIPDSICIHFCISNYLWLNFQELTMNKKLLSVKSFILFLTDQLHALNIFTSLSVESWLYKNWKGQQKFNHWQEHLFEFSLLQWRFAPPARRGRGQKTSDKLKL